MKATPIGIGRCLYPPRGKTTKRTLASRRSLQPLATFDRALGKRQTILGQPGWATCLQAFRSPKRRRQPLSLQARQPLHIENRELLTGDCLLLVAFCLYKQITAIILAPSFPGWLEPLHFNPVRFAELASFSATLTVSWVLSSLLVGGYRSTASSDLRTALRKASEVWLISMPVAACQLVLLTAAEDRTLVGGDLFASSLPLAASGPGEPIATAAGVLGIMAIWRCFYAAFLDYLNFRHWAGGGDRLNRLQDMNFFVDSLKAVFLLSIACTIIIQFLSQNVGESQMHDLLATQPALWKLFQPNPQGMQGSLFFLQGFQH